MIALGLLGFLSPIVPAYLLARVCTPSAGGRAVTALRVALALGIGLGVSSCTFFAWKSAFGHAGRAYFVAELGLVLAVSVASLRVARGRLRGAPSHALSPPSWPFAISFLAAIVMLAVVFFIQARHQRYGEWDAWANFNLRGHMLYVVESYPDLVSRLNTWPVSDYPLLLPSLLGRGWTYVGSSTELIPIAVSAFFTAITIALFTGSLALLRGSSQGLFAGVLLVSPQLFVLMGVSQYADVPLGFYMLAAVVLPVVHDRVFPRQPGLLVLAGCAAGLAAWTKNEGLLFACIVVAARSGFVVWTRGTAAWRRDIAALLSGLVPVLLVTVWFKVQVATPSEYVASQSLHEVWLRVTDMHRQTVVVGKFVSQALRFGPYAPFDLMPVFLLWMLVVGFDTDREWLRSLVYPCAVVAFTTIGYAMACLVSPYDIDWQVDTALFRLLVQLWPSGMWLALAFVRPWATLQHAQEELPPASSEPVFAIGGGRE